MVNINDGDDDDDYDDGDYELDALVERTRGRDRPDSSTVAITRSR